MNMQKKRKGGRSPEYSGTPPPLLSGKGVKEAVKEQGLLGLFAGGLKAGAVGTSAALIFGYLASLVFKPKMPK